MDPELISRSIDQAVEAAEAQGIRGKEITPFILSWLHKATEGKSLHANKQLVYHNARVASQLAVAYAALGMFKGR